MNPRELATGSFRANYLLNSRRIFVHFFVFGNKKIMAKKSSLIIEEEKIVTPREFTLCYFVACTFTKVVGDLCMNAVLNPCVSGSADVRWEYDRHNQ